MRYVTYAFFFVWYVNRPLSYIIHGHYADRGYSRHVNFEMIESLRAQGRSVHLFRHFTAGGVSLNHNTQRHRQSRETDRQTEDIITPIAGCSTIG